MKKNLSALYLALFALLLTFSACERTVEGELSSWERNANNVKLLAGKYPQFKTHLTDLLTEAEKQKEEALKLSSKEEQIKALSQASSMLRNRFVSDMEQLSPAMEDIKDRLQEIESNFSEEDYSKEIYRTIVEAENSVKFAQEAINKAEGDLITVQGIVSAQNQQLKNYQSKLMNILDAKEEADTKKAALAKDTTSTKAQKDTHESIKCSHCGSTNQKPASKCGSCGANL